MTTGFVLNTEVPLSWRSVKVAGQDPLPIIMRSNDFFNLYIKSLLGLSN